MSPPGNEQANIEQEFIAYLKTQLDLIAAREYQRGYDAGWKAREENYQIQAAREQPREGADQ